MHRWLARTGAVRVVLGLLIGVAALVGITAPIVLHGSHANAATSSPTPTPAQAIPALGRPATAADTPPPAVAKMIASGADVDHAGIRSFASTTGVGWLIPHKESLCIAIPDPVDGFGASCAPMADAVRLGLLAMMSGPRAGSDAMVVAFALAKGESVEVLDAAGHPTPLAPDENGVIAQRLPSGSKTLRITTADGAATTIPLPVPPPPPPTQRVGVVRG
jgi:hypothetical protein